MFYALACRDGGVKTIELLPLAIVMGDKRVSGPRLYALPEGGTRLVFSYVVEVTPPESETRRPWWRKGEAPKPVFQEVTADFTLPEYMGDLQPDSIEQEFGEEAAGILLEFPDIAEQVAKLPDVDEVVEWRPIRKADIPVNEPWSEALGFDLKVRMPVARDLAREKLRKALEPKLLTVASQVVLADEADRSDEIERLRGERKKLRELLDPPSIEKAQTPEELTAAVEAAIAEAG